MPMTPIFPQQEAPRHFGLRPETAQEVAALRDWLHVDKTKVPNRLLQMAIDGYDDGIAYLDDQLGQPLRGARSRDELLDNTLIIITSDHGELHGEHGIYGHGSHLYREVADVPLLVVGPVRVPRGTTIAEPVSLRDLPTTVVDLLGFAGPLAVPGPLTREMLGARLRAAVPDDEFLLTETSDELSRTPAEHNPGSFPAAPRQGIRPQ